MKKKCTLIILIIIFATYFLGCSKVDNNLIDLSSINMQRVNDSIDNEVKDNSEGTSAIFYKNKEGIIFGFIIYGHSGYAEYGSDIVCSAISTLTFDAVNSITRFTNDKFDWEQQDGFAKAILSGKISNESVLFMKSAAASMEDVQQQYNQYFKVRYIEIE